MSQLSRIIGHLAGIDDCRDLGKASVYVMMMIFAMLVIMMVMFLPMLMVMMFIIVVMIMMVLMVMMLIIVVMIMVVFMIMVLIIMVMIIVVFMVMVLIIVVMIIVMLVIMLMMMLMPMQILHVMIMIVLIENHVEITRIDRRLFHSAHAHFIPAEGKTFENFSEFFLVGSQIEKSGDSHIAADP